ncbi:MAG: FAD-dependent oxidoreductase [Burkholderiales bacterium]
MTRVVLAGGGHVHAQVLLSFRNFVSKHLDVVLVNEVPKHTYSGMVPGVIAGHYAIEEAQIDLGRLALEAGGAFIQGRVERIDPGEKRLFLVGGETVDYDVLSLNIGSAPESAGTDAIPVKPFEALFSQWRKILARGQLAPRVAVVGAGAAGVELAMAMKFALGRRSGGSVELFSDRFDLPPAFAVRIQAALARLAIPLRIGVTAGKECDATFLATGPSAAPMLQASGLQTDARGFVLVDASLRSVSHPDVFAAGDAASLAGMRVPKSGVYAVRQGPVLADNLKRAVRGMAMRDYRPQAKSLALLSCGGRYAIAARGDWSAEGAWAWRLKDWIDRRWIARFR